MTGHDCRHDFCRGMVSGQKCECDPCDCKEHRARALHAGRPIWRAKNSFEVKLLLRKLTRIQVAQEAPVKPGML